MSNHLVVSGRGFQIVDAEPHEPIGGSRVATRTDGGGFVYADAGAWTVATYEWTMCGRIEGYSLSAFHGVTRCYWWPVRGECFVIQSTKPTEADAASFLRWCINADAAQRVSHDAP